MKRTELATDREDVVANAHVDGSDGGLLAWVRN